MTVKEAKEMVAASGSGPGVLDPFNDPTFKYGNVETDLPPKLLNGAIVARITESDGETPARIIDANEAWHVDAYLKLTGSLLPMICGSLCFRLFGENIGPGGDDYEQYNDYGLIHLNPCGNGVYHGRFSVPANAVHVEHCGTPYELVVSATYLTSCKIRSEGPSDNADNLRPGGIAAMVSWPTTFFIDEGVEI